MCVKTSVLLDYMWESHTFSERVFQNTPSQRDRQQKQSKSQNISEFTDAFGEKGFVDPGERASGKSFGRRDRG